MSLRSLAIFLRSAYPGRWKESNLDLPTRDLRLFHFDRGLKITRPDLSIDFRRRQARGFVSHAHQDHMARHELAFCTPETGELYRFRVGRRDVYQLPYGETHSWGGVQLTTYPAGHCLGSAMLLVEDDGQRLLYTGDFKLGPSATARGVELPAADILVMECTFGDPQYRLPPHEAVVDQLLQTVREALRIGTPVIQAYVLGKAQEVTRLLTREGIPVLQHRDVFAVSRVYERLGVDLGKHAKYPGRPLEGHAVIVPPRRHRSPELDRIKNPVHIAVTGWAAQPDARARWNVDHAIPLSDHADFDQLLETVHRVAPREVYCTHGPNPTAFAEKLCQAGFNAQPLQRRAAVV